MKTEKVRLKSRIQTAFFGTAIIAIIILHFVSQFTFFQSENLEADKISPKSLEIKNQYETKKPDIATIPEIVPPVERDDEQLEPKAAAKQPVVRQTVVRKKESRESKSERLRRLEKVLTGA
jgi:hypothetical protein